ncbi:ImmA/IrrE family metallo-endopeptidase [Blautia sp. JLR.GB0024]
MIHLDIKKVVHKLIQKYHTRNVFELAEAMGILVLFEDLGSINGYYSKQLRIKQIHINQNLSEHLQILTCAHELGHAVMHPNANTPFLRSTTFLSVDHLEIEANKFAMECLLTDEDIKENKEYTMEQLSRIFGYSEKLIELRLK